MQVSVDLSPFNVEDLVFFYSYSLQRRYQSVTILDITKLAFGEGLEERLLPTYVPPKENQIV